MKCYISASIDEHLLEDLNRFVLQERHSRIQVIEIALKVFLRSRVGVKDEIVRSQGHFAGSFSREETYDR
jgi:metal-responsive CopG/Arc/MetJ family transcriptional regulator